MIYLLTFEAIAAITLLKSVTEHFQTELNINESVCDVSSKHTSVHVVQGNLVYANQGKVSDYEELNRTLGNLTGTIAIVRYGGAGRVDKVGKLQNFTTHHRHKSPANTQNPAYWLFLDTKLYLPLS